MPKPFILPKDIPMDRYPGPQVFLSEGRRIVDAARDAGFAMRVMGPLALHYYFPEQVELYARLERLGERYFTDIDFVAYSKAGGKLKGFMEKLGYDCDVNTLMTTGKTRQIYYGGAVPMIDVFLDKLDYCHEVNFRGRLEFDEYCISLTDITLQKLQIWEINDKDLKDLEFLFTVADVGDDEAQEDQPLLCLQAPGRRLGLLVHGHHQPRPGEGPRRGSGRAGRCPEGTRQAALRRLPGPHRGGAQDQGLAEARQEGHGQDLVQHELLGLVEGGARLPSTCAAVAHVDPLIG